MDENDELLSQEIAIIGMSGRFPDAHTLDEYWQNIRAGIESIRLLSDEDLLEGGISQAMLADPAYVKVGSILSEPEYFAASFFGYTPREAEIIDPQQRIFLECAWHAFEHAGYHPQQVGESCAVFAGAGVNTYLFNNLYPQREALQDLGLLQILLGNHQDYLALRTSYKLNLRGPSINVQTACSTGLVAVHMACQSLLNDECSMALAGAVCVSSTQKKGYLAQQDGVLSPDGHCRAFDARGQGTVPGNGVGVVILKRLADALADRDTIHAIIKSTAVDNDGADKVGFTAPSVQGQARVIREALALADISAEQIQYIEAHGTATPLGDAIELTALHQVFQSQTSKKHFCALGSVKTNIGHLDAAAGIAGLLKTVQALAHREIPPSLHFAIPNAHVDFANSPFYVNTQLREWPCEHDRPRRAGVSSFGLGGTNAHAILEEAPFSSQPAPAFPWQLVTLSAKTAEALERVKHNLHDHLQRQQPTLNLSDVAYTLQVSRSQHPYRAMFVAQDMPEALALLDGDGRTLLSSHLSDEKKPKVVFLFPGLGDLYDGMAARLYKQEAVFREHFDECATLLRTLFSYDCYQLLSFQETDASRPEGRTTTNRFQEMLRRTALPPAEPSPLNQTIYAHPVLFAIEYALAQLWQSLGIRPAALLGYSLGEYVAACLAGIFSLKDALTLVARRAQLVQKLPQGAMLSVFLGEQELKPLLGNALFLAAVNAPTLSVVAGPLEAVEELEQKLQAQGIASRRLQTTHAFHSPLMQPAIESLHDLIQQMELAAPRIPYLSCVTGDWLTPDIACNPRYWLRHLCEPLQFSQAAQRVLSQDAQVYLEIGPARTLGSMLLQNAVEGEYDLPTTLRSLRDQYDLIEDRALLLQTCGQLWLEGISPRWEKLHGQREPGRIPLPLYPFERQRYYLEPGQPGPASQQPAQDAPTLKRKDYRSWLYRPSWERSFLPSTSNLPCSGSLQRAWLIFQGTNAFCQRFVEALKTRGDRVIVVEAGLTWSADAENQRYIINPDDATQYEQLIDALQESLPNHILHLWSVTNESEQAAPITEESRQAAQRGFYSLLYLAQALGRRSHLPSLSLQVISDNLQEVTGTESIQPEKATLLAPCKVIPQEYLQIACRSIDIVCPEEGSLQEQQLMQALLYDVSELQQDKVVAYRGNSRWVQVYTPLEVSQKVGESLAASGLRQRGVYLLLGGLGKIGLALALHLAQQAKARLVLVNRTPFLPREQWLAWLADHAEEDPLSQKILQLQAIEQAGAQLHILSADIADEAQMERVCAYIDEQIGELHGVIHSAGITGERAHLLIHEVKRADFEEQLQAKLYGLHILETVLEKYTLDFCLLQSSLSPILGGLGFVCYAAGNLTMDSFLARHNQTHAQAWIGVNWEGWTFEAGERAKHQENGLSTMDLSITPQEAVQVFPSLLSYGPRLVVSSGDLRKRIQQWVQRDWQQEEMDASGLGAMTRRRRPDIHTPYVAPRNEQERRITEHWERLLGIEQIGIHDSLFDLGGHSLIGTQLLSRIRQDFQVDVSLRNLFSAPTIANLSTAIDQARKGENEQEGNTPALQGITSFAREKYRAHLSEEGEVRISETLKQEIISQMRRNSHER